MKEQQAKVGTKVRSLREFSGVPEGTVGVIDEDYGSGVMVRWNPPVSLRDGFNKTGELRFLERVGRIIEELEKP